MTEIFFATNRFVKHETSKNGRNFGDRFNAMGPQCFRVGTTRVRLTGDAKDDDAWQVGRTELFAEKLDDRRPEGALLGSAKMLDGLRRRLKKDPCDVIVYLHGFANDFRNSARRAAALQALYGDGGRRAIVVMFSWPSNGEVFPAYEYFSDRDDAEASGIAMARMLARLVEFLERLRADDKAAILEARRAGRAPDPEALQQCERKLHLVAHSMGVWALRHAVLKYALMHGGRLPRIFEHAFLMAADEDADALARPDKLKKLLRLASRVHVYHAADDQALQVSDKTKGNPDRLGTDGPDNLDLLHERVTAIDCSQVSETDFGHGRHQYYRLRDEVVADVVATLDGVPQEGREGRVTVRPGRSWRLKPE